MGMLPCPNVLLVNSKFASESRELCSLARSGIFWTISPTMTVSASLVLLISYISDFKPFKLWISSAVTSLLWNCLLTKIPFSLPTCLKLSVAVAKSGNFLSARWLRDRKGIYQSIRPGLGTSGSFCLTDHRETLPQLRYLHLSHVSAWESHWACSEYSRQDSSGRFVYFDRCREEDAFAKFERITNCRHPSRRSRHEETFQGSISGWFSW